MDGAEEGELPPSPATPSPTPTSKTKNKPGRLHRRMDTPGLLRALLFLCDFLRGLWLVADPHLIPALLLDGPLRSFLLAFHLCQALFERVHQIHNRRRLLWFLHADHVLTFQMCLDQLFHVGFEGVVILLRLPVGGERLDQLVGDL